MNITNIYGLPEPFVNACKSAYKYTPKRYSVTTVLRGACEAILKRRHDEESEMDACDMVWMVLGTAVHKIFEEAEALPSQHKEMRIEMPVPETDGYVLSGIIDLFDEATGIITDYKTASVYKYMKRDWEDYRKQLLYYAVLLKANGFSPKQGRITLIFKDFSETEKLGKPDYPEHSVFEIWWNYSEEELEAAEREIIERFKLIIELESKEDADLEPCSPEERWDKPAKWAVTKKGNKRATKLCDTEEEAHEEADTLMAGGKDKYEVTYRAGEHSKCLKYCTVTKWCPFYQKEVANAE